MIVKNKQQIEPFALSQRQRGENYDPQKFLISHLWLSFLSGATFVNFVCPLPSFQSCKIKLSTERKDQIVSSIVFRCRRDNIKGEGTGAQSQRFRIGLSFVLAEPFELWESLAELLG